MPTATTTETSAAPTGIHVLRAAKNARERTMMTASVGSAARNPTKAAPVRAIPASSTRPKSTTRSTTWNATPAAMQATGSIAKPSRRRARVTSATYSSISPAATRWESAGSATMPRGYAIVPRGIWKIVNARAKAPMAPAASVEPRIVRRSRVSWLPARPIARGPSRTSVRRASASRRSTARRVAEADAAEDRDQLHEEGRRRAGDRAPGQAGQAERRDEGHGGGDDHQVVDDRRDHRGREPPGRVQDARRDGREGEEDRAEEQDAGQLHQALGGPRRRTPGR